MTEYEKRNVKSELDRIESLSHDEMKQATRELIDNALAGDITAFAIIAAAIGELDIN